MDDFTRCLALAHHVALPRADAEDRVVGGKDTLWAGSASLSLLSNSHHIDRPRPTLGGEIHTLFKLYQCFLVKGIHPRT